MCGISAQRRELDRRERLGFVAATDKPARVRLGEGTDAGAIFAVCESGATPGDIGHRLCPPARQLVACASRCLRASCETVMRWKRR
jgi:hypothetical protein